MLKNSMLVKGTVLSFGAVFMFGAVVMAANDSDLTQVISDGTLSVDIVDAAGATVASPGVTFPAQTFSFSSITSAATLGTASEKIRAYNPTSGETWTVAIAASNPADVWTDGGTESYDFNDNAGTTGQLSVDPSGSTIAGVGGCATTNVSEGISSAFDQATVDSIDLMSAAAGSDNYCSWDQTDIDLSQFIPASQPSGTYTINMVMTIS